jgi:hypothetical protein
MRIAATIRSSLRNVVAAAFPSRADRQNGPRHKRSSWQAIAGAIASKLAEFFTPDLESPPGHASNDAAKICSRGVALRVQAFVKRRG